LLLTLFMAKSKLKNSEQMNINGDLQMYTLRGNLLRKLAYENWIIILKLVFEKWPTCVSLLRKKKIGDLLPTLQNILIYIQYLKI
jgi:hypothetical protein